MWALTIQRERSPDALRSRANALRDLLLNKFDNNNWALVDLTSDPNIEVDVRAKNLFRKAFASEAGSQDQ